MLDRTRKVLIQMPANRRENINLNVGKQKVRKSSSKEKKIYAEMCRKVSEQTERKHMWLVNTNTYIHTYVCNIRTFNCELKAASEWRVAKCFKHFFSTFQSLFFAAFYSPFQFKWLVSWLCDCLRELKDVYIYSIFYSIVNFTSYLLLRCCAVVLWR